LFFDNLAVSLFESWPKEGREVDSVLLGIGHHLAERRKGAGVTDLTEGKDYFTGYNVVGAGQESNQARDRLAIPL
jgi:hypothetical protein